MVCATDRSMLGGRRPSVYGIKRLNLMEKRILFKYCASILPRLVSRRHRQVN